MKVNLTRRVKTNPRQLLNLLKIQTHSSSHTQEWMNWKRSKRKDRRRLLLLRIKQRNKHLSKAFSKRNELHTVCDLPLLLCDHPILLLLHIYCTGLQYNNKPVGVPVRSFRCFGHLFFIEETTEMLGISLTVCERFLSVIIVKKSPISDHCDHILNIKYYKY